MCVARLLSYLHGKIELARFAASRPGLQKHEGHRLESRRPGCRAGPQLANRVVSAVPPWLQVAVMTSIASTVQAGIYCRISDDRVGAGLGVARQRQDCVLLCCQARLVRGSTRTATTTSRRIRGAVGRHEVAARWAHAHSGRVSSGGSTRTGSGTFSGSHRVVGIRFGALREMVRLMVATETLR